MQITLEEEVVKEQMVEVTVRPALNALKCDGCGVVFAMKQFEGSIRQSLGELRGTFSDAPGRGNGFTAHVCSFACAHNVFTGGWREMPSYKNYVEIDAKLERAEIVLTATVLKEGELRERWMTIDHSEANKRLGRERMITWNDP